jgi:hypothetical protein
LIQSHGLIGSDGAHDHGNPEQPEHEELTNSFCRLILDIAKEFARITFTSDNRRDLFSMSLASESESSTYQNQ